ncbi:MAG: LacI family DNA-binding transcriptional regulator [Planctomycetes bacterium]|nr:LacI family DNA-binding transcriptional regulator [Planctomycetota bacterium]
MSRVTVYHIAKEAEVSVSSVSRVLNGSRLIGGASSRRVLEIAERLGYTKRNIRKQGSRAILNIKLVLPLYQQRGRHLFYDFAELVGGIKSGCAPARVHLVTEIGSAEIFEHKKGGDIDGVIFAFNRPPLSVYRQLLESGVPHLTLNRVLKDHDYICCDNAGGVETLLRVISERMSKPRPCYLGLTSIADINRRRQQGFKKGIDALRLSGDSEIILALGSSDDLNRDFVVHLMGMNCNAVLCFNDIVALKLIAVAQDARLPLLEKMSVTGFDNSPVRDLLAPRLDTISMPVADIGRNTGAWIQQRIIGRSAEPFRLNLEGVYVAGNTIKELP